MNLCERHAVCTNSLCKVPAAAQGQSRHKTATCNPVATAMLGCGTASRCMANLCVTYDLIISMHYPFVCQWS
jgi:uncharacterized metal-binding protein